MNAEIVGKAPKTSSIALAGPAPALGDIMRVRRAVDVALTIARGLIAGLTERSGWGPATADLGPDYAAVAYHLNRLGENAGGYMSDYQADEVGRLIAATGGGVADSPGGEEFATPLAEAVDNVDREIVAHEALTVPVEERNGGKLVEAALLLTGLGLLAWALS